MSNAPWLVAILAIVGVLAIVIATRWSQHKARMQTVVPVSPVNNTSEYDLVIEWLATMDRKTWIVEELDNEGEVDYAIGNLIARKRMDKLAQSDSIDECRVVVVFSNAGKQYKCSGVFSNSHAGAYTRPKGEWFPLIAKEAVLQSGYADARIITHIVMSPEA